jgi:hypothetical protein
MKACLLLIFLTLATASAVPAQSAQDLEGVWQGYDGEWLHVSKQLVALAEATPADKFSWRPAPGVRSTGEVYMHIVLANFYLLRYTGPALPADLKEDADKTVTTKPEIIAWLKRSLEAVKTAHVAVKPKDLQRNSKFTIATPPLTPCICASSCTPTSTWASWWPTPA